MKGFFASVLIACASACAGRPDAARSPLDSSAVALSQDEVKRLAVQHCASCHQGSVSREKPAALSVFDLDHAAWNAGLKAGQYSIFYQRMAGELDQVTRARLLRFSEREARLRAQP